MVIQSIIDQDLYKFCTSYAYMKLYPDAEGTFTFNDRDNTEYTEEFVSELRLALCNMSTVKHNKKKGSEQKVQNLFSGAP